jgi:addiction module RelB/DinJ family antitoxin
MKTIINVKTDKKLKENAKRVAHELGISLSDVVNESLRQMVKNREVHFSAIPRMTPELEVLLGKTEEDIKKGRNISPAFASAKEMDGYLDAK